MNNGGDILDWNSLWQTAMAEWQLVASTVLYETCLKQTHIVDSKISQDNISVVLGVPSWFWQDEIQRRFSPNIVETLSKLTNKKVVVEYIVSPKSETITIDEATPLFNQAPKVQDNDLFTNELKRLRLEKERSLDNFAVSSSNEMAYAAARAVAERPGSAYNPLFLYGGVGVGKTHLMQGIGQEVLRRDIGTKIIYCTGEEFTNAIIEAIQRKSTIQFRGKYRTVKLLLIDDIQFIAGKNSVQEEFFHTFNAITTEGGQVIMTSDKPPKEIDSLEDRLRSRFEGGLTIDIGSPNFELRCAILMIKAEQLNIPLTNEVAQFIAGYEEDTRALVGRLVTVSTVARGRGEELTLPLVKDVLKKADQKEKVVNTINSPDQIINLVCDFYKQPLVEVLGKGRSSLLTLPRHVAMYLLKKNTSLGLVEIGKKFGGRDHTSVMHAVKKIKKELKTNPEFAGEVSQIANRLSV